MKTKLTSKDNILNPYGIFSQQLKAFYRNYPINFPDTFVKCQVLSDIFQRNKGTKVTLQ